MALELISQESSAPDIRYLCLWVHPQWFSLNSFIASASEIDEYARFLNKVKLNPYIGVVQIPSLRDDLMGTSVYQDFIHQLDDINGVATAEIGDRFMQWDRGFLDAKDPTQVQKLSEKFRLKVQDQTAYVSPHLSAYAREPKLLAQAIVFGKEQDTCPRWQATGCGITKIAALTKYYSGRIFPDNHPLPYPTKPETLGMKGNGNFVF